MGESCSSAIYLIILSRAKTTVKQISNSQTRSRITTEYALELQTLAVGGGWNIPTLRSAFCQGLRKDVISELVCRDSHPSLESLIDLVICLDKLLMEKRTSPIIQHSSFLQEENQSHDPMHLGHSWLTPSKRLQCQEKVVCFYCWGVTHIIAWFSTCPKVCEAPRGGKHFVAQPMC